MSMQASDGGGATGYTVIVPDETMARAASYLQALRDARMQPGALLEAQLRRDDISLMNEADLLGKLFDTKLPQIFAEDAVSGDGSDWNLIELGLLGDVSIAAPVMVFDDGHHSAPTPHRPPFAGTLVFTPGALLRNGRGRAPADWTEVTTASGQLSPDAYYGLYRRRLLPALRYVNQCAARPRSAFVTVPGLGCGQFAGPLRGQLGVRLQAVLVRLLTEHGASLPNIKAVYFDPYDECQNHRQQIHGVSLMVRPLRAPQSRGAAQLCRPVAYAEEGDDFSKCALYSIVAWDHVSWPGNDFFAGSRATDDGVKAAATSSMAVLTGVEGAYDEVRGRYQPPSPFRTWGMVLQEQMRSRNLRLWNPHALWRPAAPLGASGVNPRPAPPQPSH
jgi:hypothetical protein